MVEQLAIRSIDGGSNPTSPLHSKPGDFQKSTKIILREISLEMAAEFTKRHHYSKVMPRQNKICLGFYRAERLRGVITLGWGVRPRDTLRRLFPSLVSNDKNQSLPYLEIGKLCLHDSEPRNTESYVLSLTIKWLKKNRPDIKVLFTWADALWGKPGYIYQAANFYFGGSITTELYADSDSVRFHPRQLRAKLLSEGVTQEELRRDWKANNEIGVKRPSKKQLVERKWKHYFGLQFRYAYFLCSDIEAQRLISESNTATVLMYDVQKHFGSKHGRFESENGDIETHHIKKPAIYWRRPAKGENPYPKKEDIWWKVDDGKEKYGEPSRPIKCSQPQFSAAFDPRG